MSKVKSEVQIKSVAFRKQREHIWEKLEERLSQINSKGLSSLSLDERIELPKLYRATISSLSVAKSISLDKALLAYLEDLSKRAYLVVYRIKEPPLSILKSFFSHSLPQVFRSSWKLFVFTIGFFACGLLTGATLNLDNSGNLDGFFNSFFAEYFNNFSAADVINTIEMQGEFDLNHVSFSFIHMAMLCIFAFMFGFAYGIPSMMLIYIQGVSLGAIAMISSEDLWFVAFIYWFFVTNFPAFICMLCGCVAGLKIAAVFFRKGFSLFDPFLEDALKDGVLILLGGLIFYAINTFIYEMIKLISGQLVVDWVMILFYVPWIVYFIFPQRKPQNKLQDYVIFRHQG